MARILKVTQPARFASGFGKFVRIRGQWALFRCRYMKTELSGNCHLPSTEMFVTVIRGLHDIMLRPLGGHLQNIKVHKIRIAIESPFLCGKIEISNLGVPIIHTCQYKMLVLHYIYRALHNVSVTLYIQSAS